MSLTKSTIDFAVSKIQNKGAVLSIGKTPENRENTQSTVHLQTSGAESSKGDPFPRTILEENSYLLSKYLKSVIRNFNWKFHQNIKESLLGNRRVDYTRGSQSTVRDGGLFTREREDELGREKINVLGNPKAREESPSLS